MLLVKYNEKLLIFVPGDSEISQFVNILKIKRLFKKILFTMDFILKYEYS